MSDLGGFVEGMQAAQGYRQSEALFGFTLTEAGQKVEENQLGIKQKELAIKTGQMALDQQTELMRRMAARGNQAGQTGPQNPTDAATELANNLMQVANDDLAVGRFSEGAKNAKAATEILENNSKIANRHFTQQNKLFTSAVDVLGNAPDTAAGWDQAKM